MVVVGAADHRYNSVEGRISKETGLVLEDCASRCATDLACGLFSHRFVHGPTE